MSARIVLLAALITVVGPWSSGSARADFVLVPPGLGPGDQFRVVFASSATRDALSSDIADYDQFITDLAVTAGLDTYFGTRVRFEAQRRRVCALAETAEMQRCRAAYHKAESLLRQALALALEIPGSNDLVVATLLNNLAVVHMYPGFHGGRAGHPPGLIRKEI